MLPAYIIEELERERLKEQQEHVYIERPDLDDPMKYRRQPDTGKTDEQPRGVVIVDYTI